MLVLAGLVMYDTGCWPSEGENVEYVEYWGCLGGDLRYGLP